MSRSINWGVLGCARIARLQVIPAIQRSANARLCAVASRDPAKLAEFHSLFGDFTAYGSYASLISDPEIEAIYLPLPNSMHCEWAIGTQCP
jgi:predicted dehydrogenase